jgi:hypothetical protein
MRPPVAYDDGVRIRKRRRRRPVAKLAEFSKCRRYYFGRGFPTTFIAERLNLSETTVRKWRRLVSTDHTFAELRRRVLLLPDRHREQLITALVDARRVIG